MYRNSHAHIDLSLRRTIHTDPVSRTHHTQDMRFTKSANILMLLYIRLHADHVLPFQSCVDEQMEMQ